MNSVDAAYFEIIRDMFIVVEHLSIYHIYKILELANRRVFRCDLFYTFPVLLRDQIKVQFWIGSIWRSKDNCREIASPRKLFENLPVISCSSMSFINKQEAQTEILSFRKHIIHSFRSHHKYEIV